MNTRMENVTVNLSIEDVKNEAASFVRGHLGDLTKLDKRDAELEMDKLVIAVRVGSALNAARSVFKENGFKLGDTFEPWAIEFTGRSRASIHMYMKLNKNRSKFESIATGIQHAHDILAGKCDENGDYLEVVKAPKTDADILADIIKALKKLSRLEDTEGAIKVVREAVSEIKKEASKTRTAA